MVVLTLSPFTPCLLKNSLLFYEKEEGGGRNAPEAYVSSPRVALVDCEAGGEGVAAGIAQVVKSNNENSYGNIPNHFVLEQVAFVKGIALTVVLNEVEAGEG